MFSLAIEEIRKVDWAPSPQEKLGCYVAAYEIIANGIATFSAGEKIVGADDTTPIIVYLLIRAAPERVFSTMKYWFFLKRTIVTSNCTRTRHPGAPMTRPNISSKQSRRR
ncbi:MAG: hypothetical protein P4M11_03560 [Candidatus Pacebacteria bacterium]|nr:hypothetical protein [Candidatus Paceibacterota bacterium]